MALDVKFVQLVTKDALLLCHKKCGKWPYLFATIMADTKILSDITGLNIDRHDNVHFCSFKIVSPLSRQIQNRSGICANPFPSKTPRRRIDTSTIIELCPTNCHVHTKRRVQVSDHFTTDLIIQTLVIKIFIIKNKLSSNYNEK